MHTTSRTGRNSLVGGIRKLAIHIVSLARTAGVAYGDNPSIATFWARAMHSTRSLGCSLSSGRGKAGRGGRPSPQSYSSDDVRKRLRPRVAGRQAEAPSKGSGERLVFKEPAEAGNLLHRTVARLPRRETQAGTIESGVPDRRCDTRRAIRRHRRGASGTRRSPAPASRTSSIGSPSKTSMCRIAKNSRASRARAPPSSPETLNDELTSPDSRCRRAVPAGVRLARAKVR